MTPETETFTAYITKYALSRGIEVVQGTQPRDYPMYLDVGRYDTYRPGEWHRSMDAAVTRAEYMRKKKIESLKKQIAKLEKMKF